MTATFHILTSCPYDRAYQDLKGFSKNGDHFCKQLLSILQQRANLEITYSKGLEKMANKLTKVLDKMKLLACMAVGRGVPWKQASFSPPLSLIAGNSCRAESLPGWTELLLLRNLEKSATKLAKDDEDYYKKNLAARETRLKWETTLENCHQGFLELEKERLHLLCNTLNCYNRHLSNYGQSLIACHTEIQTAVAKADADKDAQTLVEEMSMPGPETKREFLLTDYYEEDSTSLIEKERRQASIKAKVLRLQKDLEKALQDKTALEQMLKAYTKTPQFSDAKNQNDITAQLEETTLKVTLLQANYFKLASVLAEVEQKPNPTQPWNDCISKWKEKVTLKVVMLKSNEPGVMIRSFLLRLGRKALYDYHTEREDELHLRKGDVIVIHRKEEDGWWYGSINEKRGIFPATYVEEFIPPTAKSLTVEDETSL
uniref:Nitric oxide synthase trafficking n=1 Tax=Varanus komodoensis TaxID=61221 RepID=A0A8D2Q993_VARKO